MKIEDIQRHRPGIGLYMEGTLKPDPKGAWINIRDLPPKLDAKTDPPTFCEWVQCYKEIDGKLKRWLGFRGSDGQWWEAEDRQEPAPTPDYWREILW